MKRRTLTVNPNCDELKGESAVEDVENARQEEGRRKSIKRRSC
jgi:hypothetical protein